MPNSPSTPPIVPNKYGIPLFLILVAAGLAGNYFKYPIFLNIDFLFGSIFAILVLQLFGLGRGIVAAALIASYTYIIWNHPYAIIIQTAEVMVVGWLFNRRKVGVVMADMLFWLIVGMPLVYFFYHIVMHIPPSNAYLTMVKQAMNGLANALVARLIFTGYALRTRRTLISYREIVYNLLTFFVLCPALILLMIGSRTDFNETDLRIKSLLIENIEHEDLILDNWAENRKTAIVNLANMAAGISPQQMQAHLEQAKKSDLNFLRIALHNREAVTTAYSPLFDELGHSTIGKSFADRPFIPILKQKLKPMLSEVSLSKTGIPKPRVAMLAPIVTQGQYNGYVLGVLSLQQIETHLAKSMKVNNTYYTLLDNNNKIIMTNRTDQTVMTPFDRGKGALIRLDQRISQWIPTLPPNTPTSERWKKSFYIAEIGIGSLDEWKLILEQPVAPFQKTLYDNYTGKLIQLFLILLGALALAEYLSRRLISTHKELQNVSRDLPAKVASGAKIDWPESGITEVDNLVGNFRETSESLANQFHEIQQINDSLEQRIDERTSQLSSLMHEVNIILENAPVGIAKIVDRKIVWGNRRMSEMFNYSKEELEGQTSRKLYSSEEAYEKLGQEAYQRLAQDLVFETEQELIRKDGVQAYVRYVGKAIDATDLAKGTIWLLEDITKRKQEEEERKAFEHQFQETQRLESLGVLAGGIAHDFNNILAIIIGNCALAKMDPDKFEKNITAIEKASERAAELCRQMLAYAGHTQVAKCLINMRTLVNDMVELMASTGHKNITIKPVVSPNIPFIHGDASQIRQILMNLITNATEAIGDAQGVIDVMLTTSVVNAEQSGKDHLGRVIPDGAYVCLEVTDNGCGMNEETVRRIFEPFFTTKFTGRGLGLSATLGIISGHDGALQLFSQPGKGTAIKVYLPAQVKDPVGDESHQQSNVAVSWQGSGTILLAEDEDQVRLIARTILKKFGFTVIEATNGREALELYKEKGANVSLVLADIGMPIMDGYELFFELKKLNPELPIIISSGFGDGAITSRIPQADIAGIISKPYNPSQLQEMLKSVIGGNHHNVS